MTLSIESVRIDLTVKSKIHLLKIRKIYVMKNHFLKRFHIVHQRINNSVTEFTYIYTIKNYTPF